VILLHGSINVSSQPGSGSSFEVRIPLGFEHFGDGEYIITGQEYAEDEEIPAIVEAECVNGVSADNNQSEKNISILIVEDNDDLRSYIKDNLMREYHIFEAVDGNIGFSLAMSIIPDLVISDVIMPGLNGVDLCERIKNDERTSHIPVIILTAKTTVDDKIDGLNSGADEYIFKPFDITELKARISNLIVQRNRLRQRFGTLTGLENFDHRHAGPDERFIARVVNIINENLKDFDFDVGALEEKAGMSRVHLYRKIKAITGLSPSLLIRNLRLKKAAGYILEGRSNMAVIALDVGFSNPSYFSRCFREYFGVLPKEYTHQHNHTGSH